MRYPAYVISMSLLIACGDEGEAGSADTGSSESSDTSARTTGSVTITTSTSGASTTATSSTTSATTQSTGETGETGVDSSGGVGTDTGAGTETGGATAGTCQQGCNEAGDCSPPNAMNCPSDEYPNNWTCADNLCVFGGCAGDNDCPNLPLGQECHEIDGVGTCFVPCGNDLECAAQPGTSCDGVADDDAMYCAAAPQPCENDDDCNGAGTCDVDSGACVCTSDDECTSETLDTCVPG